eukprot:3280803-Rhodomonas_salina.3
MGYQGSCGGEIDGGEVLEASEEGLTEPSRQRHLRPRRRAGLRDAQTGDAAKEVSCVRFRQRMGGECERCRSEMIGWEEEGEVVGTEE